MKNIKTTLIIFIFIAFQSVGNAQTKEECHAKISAGHKKICEEALKISNNTSLTKEEKAVEVANAAKELQQVKRDQEELKHSISQKFKTTTSAHYAQLEKFHAEASRQIDTLNVELKKELPDNTKVKVSALKLNEIIKSAEHEHLILKADTSPKWATK